MTGSGKAHKVYTRTGDKGKTSLADGARVPKSNIRLEAYGTVDELSCTIGVIVAEIRRELEAGDVSAAAASAGPELFGTLSIIQHELFDVGSRLACHDSVMLEKMPKVGEERVRALETCMDSYSAELSALRNFVLPGGSASAAQAHIARAVCRRAERACVRLSEDETEAVEEVVIRYLNRLSDYLFVLARHLNRLHGIEEPIWKPNAP